MILCVGDSVKLGHLREALEQRLHQEVTFLPAAPDIRRQENDILLAAQGTDAIIYDTDAYYNDGEELIGVIKRIWRTNHAAPILLVPTDNPKNEIVKVALAVQIKNIINVALSPGEQKDQLEKILTGYYAANGDREDIRAAEDEVAEDTRTLMRKRRSYFKVPNALIFDTTLSFATRRVGMIFFAYCNALGGCRKSYEAIAALAGCSVATAVKAVWELSEAGYLTVKHTKYHSGKLGRTVYGKNTYTVDLALLKKGYTILDRAVLEQELTDSALIVLCAIIVCAGNSSRAFPSISALQKKTGAARSTVCAGLRLLKALKTLLVQLCIKKNQEHSRNSYHICGVAEGNYAAASCDQHIAASDACQAPIEGFSLMGVVRFLANKVKTQITGVLNYLLKERSYRLT